MRTLISIQLMVVAGLGCGDDPLPHDLRGALAASGFTVQDGSASAFGIADCATLPDCYGSNASGTYLIFAVPPAPGAALPTTPLQLANIPAGQSAIWQLGANEAVLVYGRTPPAARYFSVTPYLFDRQVGASRTTVFGSVADATNNANMGDAFDVDAAFLVVSDAAVEDHARAALAAAGWSPETIHTIVMSPELLHLGQTAEADGVALLGRVALFDDATAGGAYLADVPLTVLRLTGAADSADSPLPAPARALRISSTDEGSLQPALGRLGAAIETSLGTTPHTELSLASYPLVTATLSPANCIGGLRNCNGEVSDTVYSAGPLDVVAGSASLMLGDTDFFIVYGVNHEAAGLARYSNMVVLDWAKHAGIAAFESPNMIGSADRYLPGDPDGAALFAVKVARSCAYQPGCIEIASSFPGVPLDGTLAFMFRAYLAPDGSVSPDPAALLGEHVIHVVP